MYKYKRKGEKPSASVKNTSRMKINADFSSLQKPVDTSASDLYQVCKLLENGTDEVKSILSYECDIIYECRTCNSLFRSIINLISHKRVYCREKFDITRKVMNKSNANSSKRTTIHMSETGQTKIEDANNGRILRSQVSKEMEKKTDLSAIIERLNKKSQETLHRSSTNELTPERSTPRDTNNDFIYLQPISTTSSAVYQTTELAGDTVDLLNEQTTPEVENLRNSQQVATSQEQLFDNQVEKSDTPIQADMSDEENKLLAYRLSSLNTLACTICNAKFSSKKTLTFHMKSLHASTRKCYSCPSCKSKFTNKWSVYRHLCKVHRKTNKQVRILESQIESAVFHENMSENISAKRKYRATTKNGHETLENIMNDDVGSQKDVMNHIKKSNVNVQRSEKTNSKKSKSASVSLYLQYRGNCSKSNPNLMPHVQDDDKPVIIEEVLLEEEKVTDVKDVIENIMDGFFGSNDKLSDPDLPDKKEDTSQTDVKVASIGGFRLNSDKLSETDLPSLDGKEESSQPKKVEATSIGNFNRLSSDKLSETDLPQLDEKKEPSRMNIKVGSIGNFNKLNSDKLSDMDLLDGKEETSQMDIKLASFANFKRLRCLICNRKLTSVPNLRRHIAIHIGWSRYRCKLCSFHSFTRCECKTHLTKHHDVDNNSATMEEMIVKIPLSEYIANNDIIINLVNERERLSSTDVANALNEEERTNESVADVSAVSCNQEIHADSNNSNNLNVLTTSCEATVPNKGITDSYCNVNHDNSDDANTVIKNLKEYMMSHDPGKVNKNLDHSNLRQMVMEMIVGSEDSDPSIKESDPEKFVSQTNYTGKQVDMKNNGNSTPTDKNKEANSRSVSDHLKHQRPMRNRGKFLSDDFIYDLKEISHKRECAFHDPEVSARKKAK